MHLNNTESACIMWWNTFSTSGPQHRVILDYFQSSHWYRPLWEKWWYFSFQKWMLSNNWTIWQSTIERIMLETCLSQIVLFRSPIKLLITKKLLIAMTALFFSNCQVHRCSCTQSDNISLLLRILKAHVYTYVQRTVRAVVCRKLRHCKRAKD